MEKISKRDYEERLERITEIFSAMIRHTEDCLKERCPYKNRLGRCTAKLNCRNQVKSTIKGELCLCVGDDRLDYRSAWKTS